MAHDHSVSVVIAAYTEARWSHLAAALASVQQQTRSPLEVIVAVDYNPALAARVRAELPGALAVENDGPQGASGARNSGVAAAQGDVIVFLDDDATAEPDLIERLLAPFANPSVLGVGGLLEPAWESGRPAWFPDEFLWVVGCSYRGLPTTLAPVRNLIAANMAVRKDVFLALGGFRRGFGKVGSRSRPEETDLCIQALQRWPARVWLHDPAAVVHHSVPASRTTFRYFLRRCYNEGLGKAQLAHLVGAGSSLSAESSYTVRTLPSGVAHGLADAVHGRPAGLARAAAIVVGLAVTAAGYLVGVAERAANGLRGDRTPATS